MESLSSDSKDGLWDRFYMGAPQRPAVRRAIQRSPESLRVLAKRNGVNPKTIANRRSRKSVAVLPTGPKKARSTGLSVEEEAVIVAFRKDTLLPLDGCLYALRTAPPANPRFRIVWSAWRRPTRQSGIRPRPLD
jgi:hypothetical protein